MGLDGLRHAPAALSPGKRPNTHCTGGWVGPRGGLCYPSRLRNVTFSQVQKFPAFQIYLRLLQIVTYIADISRTDQEIQSFVTVIEGTDRWDICLARSVQFLQV
jgi:hypothetical protein